MTPRHRALCSLQSSYSAPCAASFRRNLLKLHRVLSTRIEEAALPRLVCVSILGVRARCVQRQQTPPCRRLGLGLAAVGLGASQARSTLGIALAAWSAKSKYTYPVAALAACIHQIPTDIGVALASAALAQDCEQVEAALRAIRRVSKPRKKNKD